MEINKFSQSRILFSIPIYIRTKDDWHKDYQKKLKTYLSNKKKFYEENEIEMPNNKIISWEIHFNERSKTWRYNEIIGFLEIKYNESKLYSFLYKVDAKQFKTNLSRKRFVLDHISLPEQQLQLELLDELENYISRTINYLKSIYPKFSKYYFDIESIHNLISIVK